MAFEEGNLVDTQRRERVKCLPLHGGGDPAVEDAYERISGDIFLGLDIAKGASDQLNNQMALVGLGVQRVGVIPVELLGS